MTRNHFWFAMMLRRFGAEVFLFVFWLKGEVQERESLLPFLKVLDVEERGEAGACFDSRLLG